MNKNSAFRLEPAIKTWRHTLKSERFLEKEDLDELEQHVRDQIEYLQRQGKSEAEAFQIAMESMGSHEETKEAYKQVYWSKLKHERRLSDEFRWRLAMLKSYAKVALRNLTKQKGFAAINITGLAFGMACFILIALFVQYELSYDQFHEKADRIYRIVKEIPGREYLGSNLWSSTPRPLDQALTDGIPEIEFITQFDKANSLFEYENQHYFESGIFATEHFFDVFSFDMLAGNPATALKDPNAVILTEKLAKKYFGEEPALGQTLIVSHNDDHFSGKNPMQVTGIIADVPANSHFTFDYIVSEKSSHDLTNYLDRWDSNNYYTYVALKPDHSYERFASLLPTITRQHMLETEFYGENPDKIGRFIPQPLNEIHLHSNVNGEFATNGDIKYVYLFSSIALLILLVACINYINLTTARSATRAMEVGVRKVMGAGKSQLVGQFMSEAILPSLFALMLALVLVFLFLPTFNALMARDVSILAGQQAGFFGILLVAGLGAGILAGSYPALSMSSFSPINMMKGLFHGGSSKRSLRNALVVVQFSISIILIVSIIVIQRQLHYIQNENTGLDREQIVSIRVQDQELYQRYPALKDALLRDTGVLGVTAGQVDPTDINSATSATAWEGNSSEESVLVYRSFIQHGFVDMFDLELAEGRDFSESVSSDATNGILINETLRSRLGWEEGTGKWFNFFGRESTVIGVIKDFNFRSFHQEIAPLALFIDSDNSFAYRRIFVEIGPGNIPQTLAHLETTMRSFSPDAPFEYHFLDDAYDQMYKTEVQLGKLIGYFSLVALIIACMGLLGLATYAAQQRRKEIGVRKVLGASIKDILMLLSKDFTRLVLIAFVLITPVSYLLMSQWLHSFAYRISIGAGTILLAGVSVLVLAWLTISVQAFRAAIANPTTSIRYE